MSGALGRLPYPQLDVSSDANQLQSYLDQISHLHGFVANAGNPAPPGQSVVSADRQPFDPLAALTPGGGGLTASQLAAAHAQRQSGQQLAIATTLGMAGGAPNALSGVGQRATIADRGLAHGNQGPEGPLVGQDAAAGQGGAGSGGASGGAPSNAYQSRGVAPHQDVVSPDVARIYEPQRPIETASTPPYHELHPGDASAEGFHPSIAEAKQASPHGAAVTLYDKADYAGMRLFTTPKRDAGFALKGDDIVSVFKHPDAPYKRVTRSMLDVATSQGGRRLDAFDTALPHLYSQSGFRAVARLPWNEEYAPEGWSHETFKDYNGGRPDVVFMVHDPHGAGPYKPGDGKPITDYDEGVQAQHDALAEIDRRKDH